VISKFFYDARSNAKIQIFGDGKQTRDFVYVRDVVRANLLAAKSKASGTAINVGSGVETSINDLAKKIKEMVPTNARIVHTTPRVGDGRRSLADISLAKKLIDYEPETKITDGLEKLSRFMS
jgi:UDP-glucose 4-epimerase